MFQRDRGGLVAYEEEKNTCPGISYFITNTFDHKFNMSGNYWIVMIFISYCILGAEEHRNGSKAKGGAGCNTI